LGPSIHGSDCVGLGRFGSNFLSTITGRFGLGSVKSLCLSVCLSVSEINMGWVHPWVGLGRPRSVWVELFINYHGSIWVGFGEEPMSVSMSVCLREMNMGWVHPWVGLGRLRSVWVELFINRRWVGLGWVE